MSGELATQSGSQLAQAGGSELQVHRGAAEVQAETEAKIMLAKRFPRDEISALAKLGEWASRFSFANAAFYSFPRGATNVIGPSIKLLTQTAAQLGNITFKFVIVDESDGKATLRGIAWDLEKNVSSEVDRRIAVSVQRKVGNETQWSTPNERDKKDLYLLEGSKAVRKALENLIPSWIVDELMEQCVETVKNPPKDDKLSREQWLSRNVASFGVYGVTPDMLCSAVDVPSVAHISNDQMVHLMGLRTRLSDGEPRSDVFPLTSKGRAQGGAVDASDMAGVGAGALTVNPHRAEEKKPAAKAKKAPVKTTRDADGKPVSISDPNAEPPDELNLGGK